MRKLVLRVPTMKGARMMRATRKTVTSPLLFHVCCWLIVLCSVFSS